MNFLEIALVAVVGMIILFTLLYEIWPFWQSKSKRVTHGNPRRGWSELETKLGTFLVKGREPLDADNSILFLESGGLHGGKILQMEFNRFELEPADVFQAICDNIPPKWVEKVPGNTKSSHLELRIREQEQIISQLRSELSNVKTNNAQRQEEQAQQMLDLTKAQNQGGSFQRKP